MKEKILEVLKENNEEIVEDMDRDLLASGCMRTDVRCSAPDFRIM